MVKKKKDNPPLRGSAVCRVTLQGSTNSHRLQNVGYYVPVAHAYSLRRPLVQSLNPFLDEFTVSEN
ncbi:hypothetical protein I7I50_06839 [Histoplasma capsulatum G186AR]|uniref:Uncharacterized protein n=1 Tax=Ajellomyces capsulatus TaxID=5037 RepID=A0A8H7YXA7_AJECA|nr:hypothetical protein I7I52_10087 [Histoplasma capsulatum]QSS67682.1 hypothetical protein I7I50_06839 [Histoplasma capsulatum G186AR]